MKRSRNQLKTGVVLSYTQMAMGILIQIVYTPFAIHMLGDNEYGLLQTAHSTVAMLSVLSLGFNSSYIRYYSRYKQKNDIENIYRLNGLFLTLFSILGTVVLVCGLALSNNLEAVFSDGLTPSEYTTGRILLIISTITLAVSFVGSVFTNIIAASEKYIFMKTVGIVSSVGGPLCNFIVLYFGMKSVAVTVVGLVLGVITLVAYSSYVLFVLKQRFVFRKVESGLIKSLFRFTFFILINIIVDQVNNQVDKVLLARFCGTAVVAIYAVGINFSNYYTQFSTAISSIFVPRVHKMVISTEKNPQLQRKTLTDFLTKVGRIQFYLLSLILSGFILFGKHFLYLWVGPGYDESYYVALVCMIPATVPLIQNVGIEIQRAQNQHHYRSYVYGIIAVVNVLISIPLCQKWGAAGAAAGTGLACVLGNILIMNYLYHKKINIDIFAFWRSVCRQIVGLIPAYACGILLVSAINIDSWIILLGMIGVYTGIYCLCAWLFSFNLVEKNLCRQIIQRLLPGEK